MEFLSIFSAAAQILGAFKGNPEVAKATGYVQDAAAVVGALGPLVQSFASGNVVTTDEVRAALSGMHTALSDYEALVVAAGG